MTEAWARRSKPISYRKRIIEVLYSSRHPELRANRILLFIGEQFKDIAKEVKNNNDLLNISKPELVIEVHEDYLRGGADIIETNTFNGQRISQADYGLEHISFDINKEASKLARIACDNVRSFI